MQQKYFFMFFLIICMVCEYDLFSSKKDISEEIQRVNNEVQDDPFLLTLDEELFFKELENMEKKEEAEKNKKNLCEEKVPKSFKTLKENIRQDNGAFSSFLCPAMKKNYDGSEKKKFSLNSVYMYDPEGKDPENRGGKKKRKFVRKFLGASQEKNNLNESSSNKRVLLFNGCDGRQVWLVEEDINNLIRFVSKEE